MSASSTSIPARSGYSNYRYFQGELDEDGSESGATEESAKYLMCPEAPERTILHDSQAPIEAVLEAAGVLCPNGNERTIDPETQARLEAVLEAAGAFQILSQN